jgi:succinate dehydrogenase hydrophobic anchor subunit
MTLSGRLSTLLLVVLGLCLVHDVSGAWQQIADYTDCGSTNFVTEKILVDFNTETFWLNVSIVGQFSTEVVDTNPNTYKICMS